jgi:transcriptional regulator of acetoin/glycerol metabolism
VPERVASAQPDPELRPSRSSGRHQVSGCDRVIGTHRVAQHRRGGTIYPADLPPECWSVSRRLLSPLESMERDAIVQSLLDHQGNKAKGAESLGISRATIYRKIHEYGIITQAS